MDGTSPGNMPSSLVDVWVGTTVCAPQNPVYNLIQNGQQNCIIDWPPPGWQPAPVLPQIPNTYRFTLSPTPPRLSDEEVERIVERVAKRVVELLNEVK